MIKSFSVKKCYYWVQCVTTGYKELQLSFFDFFYNKTIKIKFVILFPFQSIKTFSI